MSNKKTLCISTPYYPPHIGGVERFSAELAKAVARMGHRVVVLTCNYDNSEEIVQSLPNITICRIPVRNLWERFPLPYASYKNFEAWKYVAKVPFDAFIVNTRFFPISWIALQLAKKQGIEPIVIEHGSGYLTWGNSVKNSVLKRYEHLITNYVSGFNPRFYGVSLRACEWLGTFGISAYGCIPNSIDSTSFLEQSSTRDYRADLGISEDTIIVSYSGRLIPEKGVDVLIEVAKRFIGQQEKIAFLIAGSGPEQIRYNSKRPCNVFFLGGLSRPDIAALLIQSDCFCFPSSYPEGLPTSLLEAAVGLNYIIVSNTGGSTEVVPNDNYGKVLNSIDVETVYDEIKYFVNNRAVCNRKALACKENVEQNLNWNNTARLVLDICKAEQDPG